MRASTILGVALIVFGILALAYQGFSYTKRERVLDLGPAHVTKDTTKTVPIPPIIGGIALVGGIVIIAASAKKS